MQRCVPEVWLKLESQLAVYGLELSYIAPGQSIPGSYWGEPEAGLIGHTIYARSDTPLHSVLHEAGHVICMNAERRSCLDTDAGGNDAEESAVCYLQILLAGVVGIGVVEITRDMDAWGYSFRLGSAHAWYLQDADDAYTWLRQRGLLSGPCSLTWRLRTD